MTGEPERDYTAEGERSYQEWRDSFLATPENRRKPRLATVGAPSLAS